ncbi:MAG TPA: DNA polymerase III subunit delta [Firmicutes bacterium]|jgi:DNA polymerase-3 subunit delta|nr:DNA polymerase III subunit delta [Bacillota bacterium]
MDFRQAGERIRRGEIAAFYLFNGPDEYLKKELLQDILSTLEGRGKRFSMEKVDAGNLKRGLPGLVEELQQATIQASFLAEGRILWVYNSPFFSSTGRGKPAGKGKVDEGENAINLLLRRNLSENIVIFSVSQVDKRRRIVKIVEKAGKLVDFPLLRGAALLRWVEGRLAQENLQADEDAAQELVERTGENLTLLDNEIRKIKLYTKGKGIVSAELVRELVPGGSQGNVFQLTDAIGRKNMEEAVKYLDGIRAQGEHPLIILAMIARQFRLLFQLGSLGNKNYSRREILALLKVQPFLLNKLQDQVKNYTLHSIARIIFYLKETDVAIKSGQIDAEDALEQMILRLTI